MTPKKPTYERGEVTAWVRDRYKAGMKQVDILQVAAAEHVPFKESSIAAAFYAIKRGVPQPPKKGTPTVAAGLPQSGDAGDELVRLVDDAIAGLHLVREAAVKLGADRAKMAQILALAQQLQT